MPGFITFLILIAAAGTLPVTFASGTGDSAVTEAELPKTGFELSEGEIHTTHEEELAFLQAVADHAPRMTFSHLTDSVQGRPVHLVRVGYPSPPSDEAVADGDSILVIGGQHGNEPAGREMALILLRDLAFTDDPVLIDQLSTTTVLFIPTANPDGRVADTRGNGTGVDLNRDHLALATPEGRAMASVLRDFTPRITIDAHEGPSTPNNPDETPRLELSWPRHLNVDESIRELSREMVEDHIFPPVREAGYTARVYGSPGGAGGGDERILRNMIGLRNGVGMLIETFNATPAARVDLQLLTVHEVLRFHRERGDEVATTITGARDRLIEAGATASRPVYLSGADWDDPSEVDMIDPAPCGYLLNTAQADMISRQAEYFPLELEPVSEQGVYLSMAHPLMTVIPLLLDERASYNMVEGKPLDDCSDPAALEPPDLPPPPTAPARFFADFSGHEPDEPPAGWSMTWTESQWEVTDEPKVLRHTVDTSGGRRALVWDETGTVSGDVEVRTKVRFQSANTLFQLPLHVSGEAGSENAYYIDVRVDQSNIRINRYLDGSFSTLGSSPYVADQDTWYHVRFRREGTSLMAKIWEDGEDEPEDWNVTLQDNSHHAGAVGFAGFQSNSVNDWAFLGVGTGGETAPDSPETYGFSTWPVLEQLPAGRRGPNDRNGPLDLPNLLAYAMNLNPLDARPEFLPRLDSVDRNQAIARFRFRRATNHTDAVMHLETSDDLNTWNPGQIYDSRILDSGPGWEHLEVDVATPSGDFFFIRQRTILD